nr:hypothetical protein [Tanacetum cinerariifolium]
MSRCSQEQNTSEANEEGASSSTRGKTCSSVWIYFTRIPIGPDGVARASCNSRGAKYTTRSGTTNMIRHISKCFDLNDMSGPSQKRVCLDQKGIKKKVFTITLDNAAYNNGVVECLKDHLRLNDALVLDGEYLHVRCGTHILNLIVQSRLKVIEGAIEKSLKCGRHVRQDIVIRWNYTYLMLDCTLVYERAYTRLKTSYPTSYLYFHNVWKIQLHIQEATNSWDPVISGMAKKMKTKFEKYWDTYSMILSFAVILDPRYKMKIVEYYFDKLGMVGEMLSDKFGSIESGLRNLYNGYKSKGVKEKSQLDKYLEEPPLDRFKHPDLKILQYWKENQGRWDPRYKTWTNHEEPNVFPPVIHTTTQPQMMSDMTTCLIDLNYIPPNNKQNEPTQGDIGQTSNEPTQAMRNHFKELYVSANEELYPLCMKESSFMLMLLIPSPKSSGKDIDVYLRPLIDELKDLWAKPEWERLQGMPYRLQQYLPTDVAKPIIKLCLFFKQICSQTLMVDDMVKAQRKVVDIWCNLELIYLPGFFDIMIHLVIHLPLEALEGGPIRLRWMMFPQNLIGLTQELKKVIWYVLCNNLEINTYRIKFKRGVIMVEDNPNIIHVDNSSDLALTTSLNDMEITALHIDGQSINVDAPQDIIDVDENDDIMKTSSLLMMMMMMMVQGHPKPNLRGRNASRMHTYKETRNLRLRKHPTKVEGGVLEKIKTQFELKPHMQSKLLPEIKKGIDQHLGKIYTNNKSSLKRDYWVKNPDNETYDMEAAKSMVVCRQDLEHLLPCEISMFLPNSKSRDSKSYNPSKNKTTIDFGNTSNSNFLRFNFLLYPKSNEGEDESSVVELRGVKGCIIIAVIYDLGVTVRKVRRT